MIASIGPLEGTLLLVSVIPMFLGSWVAAIAVAMEWDV